MMEMSSLSQFQRCVSRHFIKKTRLIVLKVALATVAAWMSDNPRFFYNMRISFFKLLGNMLKYTSFRTASIQMSGNI